MRKNARATAAAVVERVIVTAPSTGSEAKVRPAPEGAQDHSQARLPRRRKCRWRAAQYGREPSARRSRRRFSAEQTFAEQAVPVSRPVHGRFRGRPRDALGLRCAHTGMRRRYGRRGAAPTGQRRLDGRAAPVIALMADPKPCVATSGRPRAAAASAASAATPTSAHTRRPRRGPRAALAALSAGPSSFASSSRRVRPGVQTCWGACASSYRVERPRPTRTTSPADTSSDRSHEAWERATRVRRAYSVLVRDAPHSEASTRSARR